MPPLSSLLSTPGHHCRAVQESLSTTFLCGLLHNSYKQKRAECRTLVDSTPILNFSDLPATVLTLDVVPSYNSITIRTNFSGTLCLLRAHSITSLGTRSNAFPRSTNTWYNVLFFSLYFSCSCLNIKIESILDFPLIKPNCLLSICRISPSLPSSTSSYTSA